jgi:hypothetical protein
VVSPRTYLKERLNAAKNKPDSKTLVSHQTGLTLSWIDVMLHEASMFKIARKRICSFLALLEAQYHHPQMASAALNKSPFPCRPHSPFSKIKPAGYQNPAKASP